VSIFFRPSMPQRDPRPRLLPVSPSPPAAVRPRRWVTAGACAGLLLAAAAAYGAPSAPGTGLFAPTRPAGILLPGTRVARGPTPLHAATDPSTAAAVGSAVSTVAAAGPVLSWGYQGPPLLTAAAPSGVNLLPGWEQQLWFLGCLGLVLAGAVAVKRGLLPALRAVLPKGWYQGWTGTFPFIGVMYVLAGVSHFLIADQFAAIYPPPGAWGGLWQLPGSADFHVLWTGIAEILGGAGLATSALVLKDAKAAGLAALLLFALTVAVTPANIYMFTHGAQLPPGLEVPIAGHCVRAVLQMVLLGFLWEVADPSPAAKE